ncbi:hypothetical protein DFH28DRAFT_15470 [Melampsora americana]|nr:hypothetical protein DFH28DRAFT_15470 [Melampsora americana]
MKWCFVIVSLLGFHSGIQAKFGSNIGAMCSNAQVPAKLTGFSCPKGSKLSCTNGQLSCSGNQKVVFSPSGFDPLKACPDNHKFGCINVLQECGN